MANWLKIKCWLFVPLLGMTTLQGVNAASVPDVLDRPAMMVGDGDKTRQPEKSLLVDVVQAGDRLVAVGARGHIVYSDDSGQSWTQAEVPVSVLLTSVHFPDANNGWAVGHGAVILKSSDAGASWQLQFDGNKANELVLQENEARVARLESQLEAASEEDIEDLEFKLEEAEWALEDAKIDAENGAAKPLLDVWFADASHGFAVGSYGFIFHTSDGGESWQNWGTHIGNIDRFHYNAMGQVKGGALFIAGEAGTIYRSVDNGENWETLESPYDGSFFGVSGTDNVNEVVVFGLRGNMYRSDDLGRTWKRLVLESENTLMGAALRPDGILALVGSSGTVATTGNSGQTFQLTQLEDRMGLTAVIGLNEDGDMLLVGESGVRLAGPTGASKK